MTELLFKEEVFKIVGAAIEVHRELGSGFLEPVYQEAMAIELVSCSIPFESQKALDHVTAKEEAQALNYLKVTKFQVAVLLNFGSHGKLEWKRLVL